MYSVALILACVATTVTNADSATIRALVDDLKADFATKVSQLGEAPAAGLSPPPQPKSCPPSWRKPLARGGEGGPGQPDGEVSLGHGEARCPLARSPGTSVQGRKVRVPVHRGV